MFSIAIENTTAYKCRGTLEAELWVASASALFLKPSNAMSSEGTALLGAHPPEQCAHRLLQGLGPQPCHRLILSSVWSCVDQRMGFS